MEIGLNIVSDEQLRKAQSEPERYRHIMYVFLVDMVGEILIT